MLLKHSGAYLLVRIIPALVSFASLVVYTRILSPEDYGLYMLAIAAVVLVKGIGFSWLEMSLLRILPEHRERPQPLLSTVLALFLLTAAATGVVGAAAGFLWPDPVIGRLILFGLPLLWAHSWFELNLALLQAKLMPGRYGIMLCARSVVALGLGAALVLAGLGSYGPLIGTCVGAAFGGLVIGFWDWRSIRPRIDNGLARSLARYGIPLTGTVVLAFLLDISDRFMISAFLGQAALGPYAAAFDLAAQTLAVLMMVVNLAAYPLAMRAYAEGGLAAADHQIRQNGSLLLAAALPAAVGIVVLTDGIAGVLLGSAFREQGALILPWIAAGILVGGFRSFFFDLAFQLKKRTDLLMWGPAVAAVCNILLNLWLIPAYGIVGAAWSTLASYVVALAVCIVVGRRLMAIRLDGPQVMRIVFASAAMGLALVFAPAAGTALVLAMQVLIGIGIYAAAMLAANGMDSRTHLFRWLGLRFAKAPS